MWRRPMSQHSQLAKRLKIHFRHRGEARKPDQNVNLDEFERCNELVVVL
jgi:hypothetical protein